MTNHDLIQAAENGRAVVASDLNNDGFPDLVVRNMGGYDSRSPAAKNLKTVIDGRTAVVPAHNFNYPTPTNYEPGRTVLLLNTYTENNWLKVRLVDDAPDSFNRDSIGARVIVNGSQLRVKRSGDGGFLSNTYSDLHFGLGQGAATRIEVHWPDRSRAVSRIELPRISNRLITISKTDGLVADEAL